tara:strand:+ start:992 stop:1744 length:753 start_codon:yes stop_codon:yes gene_type:complete
MSKTEMVVNDDQASQMPVMVSPHMRLIEMAVSGGADITQLEKLMDLQERYEANQAKKDFNAAMSTFQSMLPVIGKTGNVFYEGKNGKPNTDYDYAKLEDIAKAIKPALKETGLSYRFTQTQNNGWITVNCIVTHASGHSEISELTSQPDVSGGKDSLKAIASAISYLRRYTLTGSLGIVVGGEDDDGGSHQEAVEVSDCYPNEDFNKQFPNWEKAILKGRKTPDQIIASGNGQGITFSDEQLNLINNVGK